MSAVKGIQAQIFIDGELLDNDDAWIDEIERENYTLSYEGDFEGSLCWFVEEIKTPLKVTVHPYGDARFMPWFESEYAQFTSTESLVMVDAKTVFKNVWAEIIFGVYALVWV